jgi:class 3 adenylate cyclase/CheY-like chemotaxis protein
MPNVLIVDDGLNRETLAARLELMGYRVSGASDANQALETLAQRDFDLVLLDAALPETGACEILEHRQSDPRLQAIPFLTLARPDEMEDVARCLELGAEDYLYKPVDPVLLQRRIDACLERKRWREQEGQYLSTIEAQAAELARLGGTLEGEVQQQAGELARLSRLRRFLSPQLAEVIASSGDESLLQSHRREITVAFCDLRGFTAFSETAEPEDVMGVLREYHAAMGDLIFQHEGTLERFAGDGMMVFFNDPVPLPDPGGQAVRMALAMRERAAQLAVGWRKRGYDLGFGMGVAMGYATLGRIGFEGRFDYGAIGSVTNLASRLSDEASAGQILISRRVSSAVEEVVEVESIGRLTLKGFQRPIEAFNVVRLKG